MSSALAPATIKHHEHRGIHLRAYLHREIEQQQQQQQQQQQHQQHQQQQQQQQQQQTIKALCCLFVLAVYHNTAKTTMKRPKEVLEEDPSDDDDQNNEGEGENQQKRHAGTKRRRTMNPSSSSFASSSNNSNNSSNIYGSTSSLAAFVQNSAQQQQQHQSSNAARDTAQSNSNQNATSHSSSKNPPPAVFSGAIKTCSTSTATNAVAPTIQTSNLKKSKTTPVNAGSSPLFSTALASNTFTAKPSSPPVPGGVFSAAATGSLFKSPPQAKSNAHSRSSAPTIQLRKKSSGSAARAHSFSSAGDGDANGSSSSISNFGAVNESSSSSSNNNSSILAENHSGANKSSSSSSSSSTINTQNLMTGSNSGLFLGTSSTHARALGSSSSNSNAFPITAVSSSAATLAAPDSNTSRPPRPHSGLSSQTKKLPPASAQTGTQRALFESTQPTSASSTAPVPATPPRSRHSALSAHQGGNEYGTLSALVDAKCLAPTPNGTPDSAGRTPRASGRKHSAGFFAQLLQLKKEKETGVGHAQEQTINGLTLRLNHFSLCLSQFGVVHLGLSGIGRDFAFPWNQLGLTFVCDLLAPLIINMYCNDRKQLTFTMLKSLIGNVGADTNNSFLARNGEFLEVLDKVIRKYIVKSVAKEVATTLCKGNEAPPIFKVVGQLYGPFVETRFEEIDRALPTDVEKAVDSLLLNPVVVELIEEKNFSKSFTHDEVVSHLAQEDVPRFVKERFHNTDAVVTSVQDAAMEQLAKTLAVVFTLERNDHGTAHDVFLTSNLPFLFESDTGNIPKFASLFQKEVAKLEVDGGVEHARWLTREDNAPPDPQAVELRVRQEEREAGDERVRQAEAAGDARLKNVSTALVAMTNMQRVAQVEETKRNQQWKEANMQNSEAVIETAKALQKSEEEQTKRNATIHADRKGEREHQLKMAAMYTQKNEQVHQQPSNASQSATLQPLTQQLQQVLHHLGLPAQLPLQPTTNNTGTSQPSNVGQHSWLDSSPYFLGQHLASTVAGPQQHNAVAPRPGSALQQHNATATQPSNIGWQQPLFGTTNINNTAATQPSNIGGQQPLFGTTNINNTAATQPSNIGEQQPLFGTASNPSPAFGPNTSAPAPWQQPNMSASTQPHSAFPQATHSGSNNPFSFAPTQPADAASRTTDSSDDIPMTDAHSSENGSSEAASSAQNMFTGLQSTAPGFHFSHTGSLNASTAPAATSAGDRSSSNFGTGLFGSAFPPGSGASAGSGANFSLGGGSVPAAGGIMATSISQPQPAFSGGAPPSAGGFDPHAGAYDDDDL